MKEVEELVSLLDQQIELLQRKSALMQGMSDSVRRGEMGELRDLVQAELSLEATASNLEHRTGLARKKLGRILGQDAGGLTLGRLVERLDGPMRIALSDRRERLVVLVERLRREANTAAMLVRQAIALNEQVLSAVSGRDQCGRTYSPDGAVKHVDGASTFRETV